MKRFIAILASVLVWAALISGCKEKFVPHVIDKDEILRYINESEVGRDLFRWDSLIVPVDYRLPSTPETLRDSVLSHSRTSIIQVLDSAIDYGTPIGRKLTANATIIDVFTVRTRRVSADSTYYSEADRSLTRKGVFLKMGSDYEPYVGWLLWSFQGSDGILRVTTTAKVPGGTAFGVDQDRLVRLTDIKTYDDGATLILGTTSQSSDVLRQPTLLLSAASMSGFMQRPMKKIDREHYTDTLKTPVGNPRVWNIIFLQTFHDNEFFFTGGFCIPYRIPQ